MPKLLVFLPCLKAINGDDGLLTIVSVLEFVGVTFAPNQLPVPPEAVVPLFWQMVSIWYKSPDDGDRRFEQVIELVLPNGQTGFSAISPIEITDRTQRIKLDGKLFPVGVPGEVIIRVGFREAGDTTITPQVEYPVLVRVSVVDGQGTPGGVNISS
jgi:hypothetical protein